MANTKDRAHALGNLAEATLNPEQHAACVHQGGPLLILAGAGSGKTRVITHRIVHLIAHEGVPPDAILAVTFTNKAADEMRERVEHLLGTPLGYGGPTIGTFHAVCARLLRRHAKEVGLTSRFSIYDATDQVIMMQRCAAELMLGSDRRKARELLGIIEGYKHEARSPEAVSEAARGSEEEALAELYARYTQRMREANAVDFGDLIGLTVQLLEGNPHARRRIQRRWRVVMVDEFQDTNTAQYRLLRALTGPHTQVTVVGDDDQSIYAWRGADIENVVRFEDDFDDTTVIKLERNYRSTQPILDVAASIMKNAVRRHPKRLWTDRKEGEKVRVYAARTDRDEARYVAHQIQKLAIEHGQPLDEFAVFYRVNAQSRVLEEQLGALGLPFRVIGGVGFYERAEIKDLLAYMKAAVNPSDAVALRRIINTPTRGIGNKTIAHLEQMVAELGSADEPATLLDAVRHGATEAGGLKTAARRALAAFVELFDAIIHEAEVCEPSALLGVLLEKTDYLSYAERRDPDRIQAIVEHIDELRAALVDYQSAEEAATLPGFLEQVSLRSPTDQEVGRGSISLMTMHGAKGLEFDNVFVVGLEEDLLPYQRADEEPNLEEERRLFYVAVTRARRRLFLTFAQSRRLHGTERSPAPSRFLKAIDRETLAWSGVPQRPTPWSMPGAGRSPLNRRRQQRQAEMWADPLPDYENESQIPTHERRPSQRSSKPRRPLASEVEGGEGLVVGATVTHRLYGVGEVQKLEDRADGQMATVYFPMAGEKKIVSRFLRRL